MKKVLLFELQKVQLRIGNGGGNVISKGLAWGMNKKTLGKQRYR